MTVGLSYREQFAIIPKTKEIKERDKEKKLLKQK